MARLRMANVRTAMLILVFFILIIPSAFVFSGVRAARVAIHQDGFLSTTQTGESIELLYDNGRWDHCILGPGGIFAVRFSPPFEFSEILSVKYYIGDWNTNLAPNQRFIVLIYDANRSEVYSETANNNRTNGWFEVNLLDAKIVVRGDFYVAMRLLDFGPCLGEDSSSPHYRSFSVQPEIGNWTPYRTDNHDTDLMIRAIVRPSTAPPVTFTFRIYDSETNTPIVGASVWFDNSYVGTTGPDGWITINTVFPPADHTYRVNASGYSDKSGTVTIGSNSGGWIEIRLTRSQTTFQAGGSLVAILAIGAISAAVILVAKRRKKSRHVTSLGEERKPATAEKKTGNATPCISCQALLPLGSKFCDNCGANQEG